AAGGVPGLASVIGALDHLTKPAARLRRVYAVAIRGRPLEVIDLPAGEVRAGDFPSLALPIRRQDERAFACTHEDPNSAHRCSLLTTGGRGSLPQVPVPSSADHLDAGRRANGRSRGLAFSSARGDYDTE